MDLVFVILAAGVPLTALAVAVAFWFMGRQQEKHLILVLDRFLSRNFQDYAMTDMTRREIAADQDEEQGEDTSEDALFDRFLADRQAAVEALGTTGEVS